MGFGSFWYLIKEGVRSIWTNRLMSFASIGTLVACMLLIGSSMLFSMNINAMVGHVEQQNEVVIILEDGLPEEEIEFIQSEIDLVGNIYDLKFISKHELLEEQKALNPDLEVLLEDLEGDENPLFDSFRLRVLDLSNLTATQLRLEAIGGIEQVQVPDQVAEIMVSLRRSISTAGMAVVLILVVVSLVIIANTIKVTVFNRRKEINIMKYVGATDRFIRLPFFVEGFILGLISALIAFGLLWIGYHYLMQGIATNDTTSWIMQIYTNMVPFKSIALRMLGWFAGGGIGIGVFGSMIFVSRYLKV